MSTTYVGITGPWPYTDPAGPVIVLDSARDALHQAGWVERHKIPGLALRDQLANTTACSAINLDDNLSGADVGLPPTTDLLGDRLREKFKGYYRPTEDEENNMWASAHIVMDTNVVLDLYKYHEKTTKLYLDSLEKFGDRIWLPYQVALEFHKNRPRVRSESTKAHKDRIEHLKATRETIKGNKHKTKIASSKAEEELLAKVDEVINALEAELQKIKAESHINAPDLLLEKISTLFTDRVGDKPTKDAFERLLKVAEGRFDRKVPPGYEDRGNKPPGEEYGDYFLWQEVMDHAKAEQKDIIIATEDNKSDWWLKINKTEIVGARPELIQEFREETGREIIFYSGRDFFKQLTDRAKATEDSEDLADALADVSAVSDDRKNSELERMLAMTLFGDNESKGFPLPGGSIQADIVPEAVQVNETSLRKTEENLLVQVARLRRRLSELHMQKHRYEIDSAELMHAPYSKENFDSLSLLRHQQLQLEKELERVSKSLHRAERLLNLPTTQDRERNHWRDEEAGGERDEENN